MRNSFEFKECERFLKRVLKDRGMFTKGAVIAYLITGGIGVVVPTLLGTPVYGTQDVKIDEYTGRTYGNGQQDGVTNSVIFAPTNTNNNGELELQDDPNPALRTRIYPGPFNRKATNSVIIGYGAYGNALSTETTPGSFVAVGALSHAYGGQGTALGSGTLAGIQATAIGNDVYATGDSSVAIGNDDIATKYLDKLSETTVKEIYGDGDLGTGLFATKTFKSSDGTHTRTSTILDWRRFKRSYLGDDKLIYNPTISRGVGSIAIGSRSIAMQDGATAIGTLSYAFGEGSTAMGLRAYTGTKADGAIAIGEESRSFAAQSLAVGNKNESSEQGSMSYGYSAKAAGVGSLAIGYHTYANTEFGTNAGAAALISGVQGVNAPLTSAQQTAWDNYVAKASAYYTEVEKYPKDPDVQGSVVAAKTAMDAAYTQLTATGFSVPNVANLTYISDGQAGNKNKSTAVTAKISALQTGATNIDTEKGTDIYLTTKNSDGSKNEVKKTVAKGANSIAIGYYSVATANSSIAQGAGTVAEGGSSIALGSLASTTDTATNSISIGVASSVKKENSIALGTQSSVYGAGSVALGAGSRVYNTNSMAMGYGSTVMAANSSAIGVGSKLILVRVMHKPSVRMQ